MAARTLQEHQEAAVIDVGSNSVRLVVYRIDGRAMTPILNEKVMAGLGRGLAKRGALAPEGVEAALRALRRFATLCEALGVRDMFAVATAAAREAEDGGAFAARVKRETGIDLRILSGADEARLSALGVSAGAPEARGMVGDLGGASLELVRLNAEGPALGETFALGPLSLVREGEFEYQRVADEIDAALRASDALARLGGDFYAVGGAWRALGRIDMKLRDHPLGVLHYHEMSRIETLRLCDLVRKQSKRSLEKLEEAAAKRADALPYAAIVLERVVQLGKFERVVLSAFGLREGVLIERMSKQALAAHPLIAAAEAVGGRWTRATEFGRALAQWIAPLFAGKDARGDVVRAAAARLADVGGPLHPDQRAEIMFDLVLRAPLAAISHEERAFLAASIHHRYTKSPPRGAPAYERLLSPERQAAAAALGAALRFGADLSGRSEALLRRFKLRVERGRIVVSANRDLAHLVTETAQRRLDAAAHALGLVGEFKVNP